MRVDKRQGAEADAGDIDASAECVLLDVVRQHPTFHFTAESISKHVDYARIRRAMTLRKDDERDLLPLLTSACRRLNGRLKCFQVGIEPWYANEHRITCSLVTGTEWSDAVAEAWSFSSDPNEFHLTDAGLSLLDYIRSGDLETGFVTERSLSYRLGFHGRLDVIEPHFDEVIRKAGIGLCWEKKGARWGADKRMYRLWTEPLRQTSPVIGINPVFDLTFGDLRSADVDRAREVISKTLLCLGPSGVKPLSIVAISSRSELLRVFPKLSTEKASDTLFSIFSALTLKGLRIGCDFRNKAEAWTVITGPKRTWEIALVGIRQEMSQPSLEVRYGIGPEAAKLLHWMETLPQEKRLLGRVTPVVEDAAEKWIGIKCPWSEENTSVYLRLLIDELNDRTPYSFELVPWVECGRHKSRIIISRKKGQVDQIMTLLRPMTAAAGRQWDEDAARRAIEPFTGCDNQFSDAEENSAATTYGVVFDETEEDELH